MFAMSLYFSGRESVLKFKISFSSICNFPAEICSENFSFKIGNRAESFSTAKTVAPASRIFSVKAPCPGPISRTKSLGLIWPAEIISRRAASDFKKFCPSDFFANIV